MTEKRFRSGFAKYDEFSDEIIDELTGKHYFDSTKDDYVFSEELVDLLNALNDENEQLKSDLDYFQRTYEIEERGLDIVAPMCTIGSPTPSRLQLFNENEQLKSDKQALIDFIKKEFPKSYKHILEGL